MKNRKKLIGISVIILTFVVFGYYWHTHPAVFAQLKQANPAILVLLAGLYALVLAVLSVAYLAILRLCGTDIPKKENLLLTFYSAIVNFFGPLQSGPGFRLIYLKKKYKVSVKKYTLANFVYYAAFAWISGLFLLVNTNIWIFCGAFVSSILVGAAIIYSLRRRFNSKFVVIVIVCTLAQLLLTAIIYFVEVKSVNSSVNIQQAFSYAGAANFAMFVSLTPGALGFRESFLFLSQSIHKVPGDTIISASILDRSVYVAFLAILFIITLSIHAKDKLTVGSK